MYFCSEIYQRTLARLAYMTDIKDFFIASNTVHNAPDYDSNILSTLIHTVEAFARVTYQSVYLIDYYRQEFLYVSDNPLFLCGHTAKEVKELGYSFYLKYVPVFHVIPFSSKEWNKEQTNQPSAYSNTIN